MKSSLTFRSLLLLAMLVVGTTAFAQGDEERDEAQFQKRAGQFEKILYRNPRTGTAFDLWYRHYLDAGKLDALESSIRGKVKANPDDPKWQIILAMLMARRGKPRDAVSAYDAARKLDPENHIPFVQQALIQIRVGQVNSGVKLLEQALEKDPPRLELLEMYKHLGRAYRRQGSPAKATATWQKMIKEFPNDVLAIEDLAELLRDEGDWKGAVEQYKAVAKLVKRDPLRLAQIEIEIAQLRLKNREAEQALKSFEEILSRLKSDSPIAKDIGRRIRDYFMIRSDMDGWIAFCLKQVKGNPENIDAKLQLAEAYSQTLQTTKALEYLQEVLKIAPKRRDVRESYVNELENAGKYAEATEHCEVLCRQNPQDVGLLIRHGQLVLASGEPKERRKREEEAVKIWSKIAVIRPDDAGLALRVAETCRDALTLTDLAQLGIDDKSGSREKVLASSLVKMAENYYREAVKRSSQNAQYHEYLGEFLFFIGKKDEALSAWRGMVSSDKSAEAWQNLARVFARYQFAKEALDANQEGIKIDKDNYASWDLQVDLLIQTGEFNKAVEAWRQLTELAEDNNQLEKSLARIVDIFAAADQIDSEIARRRKAIQQGKSDFKDHWALAMLLSEQWQFGEAIVHFEAALNMQPKNPRILQDLADALHRDGRAREAVEYFERLVKLEPRNRTDYYEKIIEIQLALRDTISAARTADILITLSPSNLNAYRIKAAVAFQSGEVAKAVDTLRRAVRVAPRDPSIRNELAIALRDQRKPHEAMEHFWRCFELHDKLEDRLGLVAVMTDLAKSTRTSEQFLQRIKQFQADDPKLVTLCLVEVYNRNRDYDKAFNELRKYLARAPQDIDVIERLAQLAESQKDLKTAIEFQKELTDLVPSEDNLRKLARLYTRTGSLDQARETWLQLLRQSKNPEIILTAVDEKLAEGRYAEALAMAEAGVEHSPTNWVLLFRAGCLELGMEKHTEAEKRFQAILALATSATRQQVARPKSDENQSGTVAVPPANASRGNVIAGLQVIPNQIPDEITNLPEADLLSQGRVAFAGFAKYREIFAYLKRTSSARRRTSRTSSAYTVPASPATLTEARLASELALSFMAMRQGQLVRWLDSNIARAENDPRHVDTIAVALASMELLEIHNGYVDKLIKISPKAPLPHVARFIQPPNRTRLQSMLNDQQREAEQKASLSSYQWIEQNRPSWRNALFLNFCTRLIYLGEKKASSELLSQRIKEAKDLDFLLQLGQLPLESQDKSLRLAYLKKLRQFAGAYADDNRRAATLAAVATMITRPTIKMSDEKEVQELFATLIDYLRSSPRTSTNTIALYDQSAAVAGRGNTRSMTLPRFVTTLAVPPVSSARFAPRRTSRTTGATARTTAQNFPAPNTLYDVQQQRVFSTLYTLLQPQGLIPTFLIKLEADSKGLKGRDRARLLSCQTSILWWMGQTEEALNVYEKVCADLPDIPDLRLSLAQAYHQRGEHARALATLNQIVKAPDSILARKQQLYEATLKKWGRTVGVRALLGHEGTVRVVRFSPDSKYLASGSYDNTIRIWETETGKLVSSLSGHEDFVLDIDFSPDGSKLVSGGYDRKLMVWDIATGKQLAALEGHTSVIRAVAFLPDGKRVVSAGDEKTVRIWSLESKKIVKSFEREHRIVTNVVFSPKGDLLLVASGPKLLVWDVDQGKLRRTITGHQGAVRAAAVSPDGLLLATGSNDRTVKLWDIKSGQQIHTFAQHENVVRAVSFSPDGKLLTSGSEDRKIIVVDVESKQWLARYDGHSQSITHVDAAANGYFASASYSNSVQVWRIANDNDIQLNKKKLGQE